MGGVGVCVCRWVGVWVGGCIGGWVVGGCVDGWVCRVGGWVGV